MNKVVLKVELQDDKIKKKAMKVVSNISGVESVSVDMKDQKLTLIGDMDAVIVVDKLRKVCYTEILSVGPAKEEKKGTDKDKEKKMDHKVHEDQIEKLKMQEVQAPLTDRAKHDLHSFNHFQVPFK